MEKKTYIGIIYDYDETSLVTLEALLDKDSYECSYYKREQLLDKDCKDCESCELFVRFIYDPFTGEKIDWDELKKLI